MPRRPRPRDARRETELQGRELGALDRALQVRPALDAARLDEAESIGALEPPTQGSQLFALTNKDRVDPELFVRDADGGADGDRFPLVSALYFLGPGDATARLAEDTDASEAARRAPPRGGDLWLKRFPDGDIACVRPRGDELVLWRSGLAYHAREPVKAGTCLAVRHWVFARPGA